MRRRRSKTQQDSMERGVWGERVDVPGVGSMMSVRGTDTLDLELPVVNFGYSFNLPADANAEVLMISLGGDVNDKVAVPILPRDLQYQWPVGTGGVQHPTNPARRIEFNGDEMLLRDGKFVVGDNRQVTITVSGADVSIQTTGDVNLNTDGDIDVNTEGDLSVTAANDMSFTAAGAIEFRSTTLEHNGTNVGDDHTHRGVDTGSGTTQGPS